MGKEIKSNAVRCNDFTGFLELLDEHLTDDIIRDLIKFPGVKRIDMWTVFILYQLRFVGVCADCQEKMTEYLTVRLEKYNKENEFDHNNK